MVGRTACSRRDQDQLPFQRPRHPLGGARAAVHGADAAAVVEAFSMFSGGAPMFVPFGARTEVLSVLVLVSVGDSGTSESHPALARQTPVNSNATRARRRPTRGPARVTERIACVARSIGMARAVPVRTIAS